MCTTGVIEFVQSQVTEDEVRGKRVLEVGALDVNGSVRPAIEEFSPECYLGVDIQSGPQVDIVCDACELVARFGEGAFDVLVCCEALEHVRDWRTAISNCKRVVRPGGIMLFTTVQKGFPYHGYPFDFWRYGGNDMHAIFSDCIVEHLWADPVSSPIYVRSRKPKQFVENNLSAHALYSIIADQCRRDISDIEVADFLRTHQFYRRFNLYW